MGSGIHYSISLNEIELVGFILAPGASYRLEAPSGWITDISGNPAAAIAGTDWEFTTAAATATGEFSNDFSDDFA